MQVNHGDRDHATWSASASKGNMACPGRLALTMNLPETTSEAADWGTCAHQIAERCLRDGGDADRFIGTTEKAKVHSFEVDEEMADTAQTYVDYVRIVSACAEGGVSDGLIIIESPFLWIEQRFSLADLNPPFDAGGTGDAVIYLPAEKRLEIVDLKGGRGVVVEASENPQLRTYALGAMLANKGLDVESVTVTIVQPRAYHKEGRIRSETFHVVDLMEWTVDLLAAMNRSKQAIDERATLPEAAWAAKWLCAGDHCADTFCKARATCPALRRVVEDTVGIAFDPIDDTPKLTNAPDAGTPEERAKTLDMLDMIEDWVKAVRAHEHRMAEMGQPASGYGLVQKQGREKWASPEAEAKAKTLADFVGLTDKIMNAPKIKTPKQVRYAFKKAGEELAGLDGLSETPISGTNLVKLSETSREPVPARVHQAFTPID